MRGLTKAVLAGSGVMLAGWIAWGIHSTRTAESVLYERLRKLNNLELRQYPQTILAVTTAANQRMAFRRLFRYISGANRGAESISMTAPVRSEATETDTDAVRMAFYLPSEYSPETAPEPTDSDVTLVTEPRKTVAVNQFSWYAPEWRVARRSRKLLSTLEREGIELVDDPYLLRYNDPWTPPFMRRNEVAVEIRRGD